MADREESEEKQLERCRRECVYLRSCKEESDTPVEGTITGSIPRWLQGSLIRVGCGTLQVGPDQYRCAFDGLALLHRFAFKAGKVTYSNRFLRSDTYRKNMEAGHIVVSEFGTPRIPDPCKTIFQRFMSLFDVDFTDNDLVNFIPYGRDIYACSETNFVWKIDPHTLQSIEKVNLSKFVPVHGATAHAHEEPDGTVYNVGSTYGLTPTYNILKFPPADEEKTSLELGSVVCSIGAAHYLSGSYHHSFGMSEHYFVFVEQPLRLSITGLVWAHFTAVAYADALHWDNNDVTRFHVVRKCDGKLLSAKYTAADTFYLFHHINAYEQEGHLVVDVCAYEDGSMIRALFVEALQDLFMGKKVDGTFLNASARRFVIPLEPITEEIGVNLVTLPKIEATAVRNADGSIVLKHEPLTDAGRWAPELPRINYERFNGRKYRYFYAVARKQLHQQAYLVKVDCETKTAVEWGEPGVIPSEPVFLNAQDATSDSPEDHGVILASLLYSDDDKKVSLLVLDAATFKEVGRANFVAKSAVPADFHGIFVPKGR